MGILWIVLVGFVAGVIARLLARGPNKPAGFLLTTALGIAGAFVATFIGQAVGWYRADQGAGFIAATVGAIVVSSSTEAARSNSKKASKPSRDGVGKLPHGLRGQL